MLGARQWRNHFAGVFTGTPQPARRLLGEHLRGAGMRTITVECSSVYEWRRDGWLAACSLTGAVLIISAATPHAPGFDTFLRIFVFCMALVRGFAGFRRGGAWLPLSAALIAILFNPVRPVGMSAIGWIWCDLIAAAWFAVVGAWRLLRSWEPQRGWAAAALSLGALAVPAVGALNAPNRDALDAPDLNQNLDENLAVMNGDANAGTGAADMNATVDAAAAGPAPAAESSAESSPAVSRAGTPQAHDASNAPAAESANRVTHDAPEVSAESNLVRKPPPTHNQATAPANEPANDEPVTNEPEGNQE
jgi:hypothetical protein